MPFAANVVHNQARGPTAVPPRSLRRRTQCDDRSEAGRRGAGAIQGTKARGPESLGPRGARDYGARRSHVEQFMEVTSKPTGFNLMMTYWHPRPEKDWGAWPTSVVNLSSYLRACQKKNETIILPQRSESRSESFAVWRNYSGKIQLKVLPSIEPNLEAATGADGLAHTVEHELKAQIVRLRS